MESSGGGGNRRRLTHQLSMIDRDIRRVNDEEDDDTCRESLAGLTLGAVLSEDKTSVRVPSVNRTLLDFINEESGTRGLSGPNRKNWKSFRDRLRVRRASAAWASSSSSSSSDGDDDNIHISGPVPTQPLGFTGTMNNGSGIVTEYEAVTAANEPVMMRLAAALATERELHRQREMEQNPRARASVVEEVREETAVVDPPGGGGEGTAEPVRVSLMSLLEETDRESGLLGSSALNSDGGEEDEEEADGDDGGGEYVCCVCMVRHKGAAFIPCGHTFCRLCSRELWVTRGNCPLCNGFILEILDIF